jgi:pSer/pThr/pTyr-binding forkhead associated (FHA) protein
MHLVLRYLRGKPVFPLLRFPPGQYVFGRAAGCHVRFPTDSSASRRHCMLFVTEQGVSVRDLGSRNSTAVNSERISREEALHHGDRLFVGGTTFLIQFATAGDALEAEGATMRGEPVGETFDVPFERTKVIR